MTTTLECYNETATTVTVWLTLGDVAGCVEHVLDVRITHPAGRGAPYRVPVALSNRLQGWFGALPHTTYTLTAPSPLGISGNISIGTPPINCPTPDFPHGVNLAEFILNNGFQTNGQETTDISCVCGANSRLQIKLSASDWSANGGAMPSIGTIVNGTWDDNTGRVGVFPYGCDDCTSSVSPPICIGLQPSFANAYPICTVQRPALYNAGGTVEITYRGAL